VDDHPGCYKERKTMRTNVVEFVRAYVTARFTKTERGASLVEYALLLALIAVVCVAAVTAMGTGLRDNYDESRTHIFGD
jgi:pilus assembly protein Flp/PilA